MKVQIQKKILHTCKQKCVKEQTIYSDTKQNGLSPYVKGQKVQKVFFFTFNLFDISLRRGTVALDNLMLIISKVRLCVT